jgi:hypothetical protein
VEPLEIVKLNQDAFPDAESVGEYSQRPLPSLAKQKRAKNRKAEKENNHRVNSTLVLNAGLLLKMSEGIRSTREN